MLADDHPLLRKALRDEPESQSVQAVRGVVAGENVLSPEIFQRIIKSALRHIKTPVSLDAGEKIAAREGYSASGI